MACGGYKDIEISSFFSDMTLTTCSSEFGGQNICWSEDCKIPIGFSDDRDGALKFPNKPSHVLIIYNNLRKGLYTDMKIDFADGTFKCHHWIIDAYMDMERVKNDRISKKEFEYEYRRCLKSPELPIVLRAYYRKTKTHDFTVLIGDEKFKCHYDVLRCYTDFFNGMKPFESFELPITEVTVRAFFMIYTGWMLEQIPELPVRGILEIYKAAEYLRIEHLVWEIAAGLREIARKSDKSSSKYDPPKMFNKLCIEKSPERIEKENQKNLEDEDIEDLKF